MVDDPVPFALALLGAFVIPIVAVAVVRSELQDRSVLNQRGIKTTGRVVDVWHTGSGESASSHSRIEFTDAQGVLRSFEKDGDDGKGKDVVVVYDPHDPDVVRVTDRTGIRRAKWLGERTSYVVVGGAAWLICLAILLGVWRP